MKVSVVVFAAIWPILLNTQSAVASINPILLDTAATLGLRRFETLRKIIIPALMPAILLGIRQAAPVTLIVTLLVEILTAVDGVGAALVLAQHSFLPARVYGLVVIAGVFGLLVNGLVAILESYILRYRPAMSG